MANPFQVCANIVTGAGTSRPYAVAAATAAGDTLCATVVVNNTACIPSALSDSQGNVYTLDRSFTTTQPTLYAYRSPGATGGSGGGPTAALATTDTYTVTTNAVSGNVELYVTDVPGAGALDQVSPIATGTSTTPSVTATPAANNEIAVTGWGTANAGGAPTVNSPFTSLGSFSTGSNPFSAAAYDVLTGGGGVALTSTLTIVSANWRGIMWLFAPGAGGTTVALPTAAVTVAAPAPGPQAGPVPLPVAQVAIAAPAPAPVVSAGVALPAARVAIAAPAPAVVIPGALIVSLAAKAGVDSYGNSFPKGLGVWQGVIQGTTIQGTTIQGSVFDGTDFEINTSGLFFYAGTPASGNLIASIARTGGTDRFGNTYLAGITSYIDNALNPAVQLNGDSATFYAALVSGQNVVLSQSLGLGTIPTGLTMYAAGALTVPPVLSAADPANPTGLTESWHALTLQNGCTAGVDINGTSYPPAIKRGPEGDIKLRGVLVSPAAGLASGTTFATVGAGYSPVNNIPTALVSNASHSTFAHVYIRPNGNLQFNAALGATVNMYLDCRLNTDGT